MMRSVKVTISGEGPALEACIDLPESPNLCSGLVLCHPHPLYGGDMDNNVVAEVGRAVVLGGMAVLRFNFRGVGRSEGYFADGEGEQEDAMSALRFLSAYEGIDPSRIGIAGYSFGGMIAMKAGEKSDIVKAIAAVSPVMNPGALVDCIKPKFIVCGSKDMVIPQEIILGGAAVMPDPKRIEVIKGVDHFWWGYERKLGDMVAEFFVEALGENKTVIS
ncbi:MAG: alpha/beta hydrolase [Bacillota bacterium]